MSATVGHFRCWCTLTCIAVASMAAAPLSGWVAPGIEAFTRSPGYGLDLWREAEGLPESGIRAIAQTRDGYIWLGTDNGVVRFNGTSFTAFTVQTGSLKDNEIWSLKEDSEGSLWIGTYGGGITRLKDGRFQTFTIADGLPDDVVKRIELDHDGTLWLSTPRGAAMYSGGRFKAFTTADGLAANVLGPLAAPAAGGVLVATASHLHQFASGRFRKMTGIVEKEDGAIEQVLSTRDGSLWVGFSNAVIKQWKNGVLRKYAWQHSDTPQITLLYEDPMGAIWAGLDRKLFKLENGSFEAVKAEDGQTEFGIIYSMLVDREGSIWLGFQSNGLARLRKRQMINLSTHEGLPNESARSVFEDSKRNVWIGTASGFVRYGSGAPVSYTVLNGHRLGPIRSFAEDRQGTLWIGEGNDLLQIREGKLTRVPTWKSNSRVEVIYRDPMDHMWIGTDGDGLFEFSGGTVKRYTTNDGLASNHVHALLSDRRKALWISTFGEGVSRFEAGVFKTFSQANGLPGNRVTAIHEDEEGAIWFTTRRGLSRLKDGRFFTFTSDCGLPVNFIYAILDDARGNFWLSSAQGIFRVSKAGLRNIADGKTKRVTSVTYGVRDGMRTRACNTGNQPAAWKTSDGRLLFSSMKGVVAVSPAGMNSNSFIPPVYIEAAQINKRAQLLTGEHRMPPGPGELQIDYAALSYLDPAKVRFKYKLEDFDKDWVDAGGRRFAYYANLPPGSYRFQVTAGSVDGPWNETGASFSFYLSPHFYQTQAFIWLAISATLILAWLLYRLHMSNLRARYTAVLAERNRISRDIHDTFAQNLAGIALHLDSVTMQLEEMPPGLRERVDEACNLTRYSLAEARRVMTDLRSDELERLEVSAALPELARRMAAGANVCTSIDVSGPPRKVNPVIQKDLLRLFQEAMTNALKHGHATKIDVQLKYEPGKLALRVSDDGCGFDTGKAIPLGTGHFGLIGMRERAERIGGILTLKSSPGEGTEVRIEVPIATSNGDGGGRR